MDNKDFTLVGLKILIVDDEPDILDLTKLIMTHYYADVIAVASAGEGLT